MAYFGKKISVCAAAAVILGTLMGSPNKTQAAQIFYSAPSPNTSEIAGDVWTKYFNAKIHLVEYNGQLMLSKTTLDPYYRQYMAQPYDMAFEFRGKDWSAQLANPIRMGINNSFHADGGYDSVIRAQVNFSMEAHGWTETRPALATVHMVQGETWKRNGQMMSLEIVDANNPNIVLYSSGNNLALEQRRDMHMLTAFLPLVNGHMDAKIYSPASNNLVFWNTPGLMTYPGMIAVN